MERFTNDATKFSRLNVLAKCSEKHLSGQSVMYGLGAVWAYHLRCQQPCQHPVGSYPHVRMRLPTLRDVGMHGYPDTERQCYDRGQKYRKGPSGWGLGLPSSGTWHCVIHHPANGSMLYLLTPVVMSFCIM